MIRDRPLSNEENTWLKIIIPDLFVFGTELHHLNRRDHETHQRAVIRRLQEHAIYCKIRAVRIHLAGMRQLTLGHNHRKARVDGAEARLDPQRRGSSTRRLTELAKLKVTAATFSLLWLSLSARIARHLSAPRPRYRGGSSTPLYGVQSRPEDSQDSPPSTRTPHKFI